MDHFESVVVEYLQADRALFLNTGCSIALDDATNPDAGGTHWYCDVIAADFRNQTVFLCEIAYATSLGGVYKRLQDWNIHWHSLCNALVHDTHVPVGWLVRPWLFIPEASIPTILKKIAKLPSTTEARTQFPKPRITPLEMVLPWKYRPWNRIGEKTKPETIPDEMKS